MTHADMLAAKSRAIRFYGYDKYLYLVRTAEAYMTNNNLPIPSGGVEEMPTFWHTLAELMLDGTDIV